MQDAPSCMLVAHRQCIATCNQQNYELLASCHGSQKDQALAACWQQDVACLQSASGGDEIACAGAAGGCEKSVLACYTGVNRGEAAIFPDCVSGQLCELALPTIDCPTTCELEGGCDKHICEANCEHARVKSELNCYPATCLVSGEICYLACEEAFLDCRAQMTSCFDDEKACVDAANACVDACPVG